MNAQGIGAQSLHRPETNLSSGAYSLQQGDIVSFTRNQGALAQLKQSGAALYMERKYLLQQLSNYHLLFGLRSDLGNFGLQLGYSGFAYYNESKLGVAYARKLSGQLDLGVQFNYHSVKIPGYLSGGGIGAELGVLLHLSDKLHIGVQLVNPVPAKTGRMGVAPLASSYSLGIGYDVSPLFFCNVVIERDENQPLNIVAGWYYQWEKSIRLKMGIATSGLSVWAGVLLMLQTYRAELNFAYHPQLGLTPGILFITNLSKNK